MGLGSKHSGQIVKIPKACTYSSIEIAQVSCGAKHTLFLTRQALCYAMGSNTCGQLGVGDESAIGDKRVSPTLIQTLYPSTPDVTAQTLLTTKSVVSGKVTQISAGGYHSLAVMENGTVYAWGSDQFGQCGISAEPSLSVCYQPTPTRIHHKISQASAGSFHSGFVTDQGMLYLCGQNDQGQTAQEP